MIVSHAYLPWQTVRMSRTLEGRWNHNIHYHRQILNVVPDGARTALDVGTGNGLLAADLRRRVPSVTAVDQDAAVLVTARTEDPSVNWVHGDVMSYPFVPGSFDVVASAATVHHLPHVEQAFRRFAELAAPGGVVVNVGLARSGGPVDRMFDIAGMAQHAVLRRRYGWWEHSAPMVWPPAHTYSEVRAVAEATLPGSRWRRLSMWRYCVTWRKPIYDGQR
ncbi:class I SAM-dependent methyltransferase [Pseudonocardia phyllosphaerae]|uniref:class I SAM-dependent methyltransferase n=1 Tax=Pseudonocardia phyllosphaerae TaxID=3390502 RepID=UPI00397E5BE6